MMVMCKWNGDSNFINLAWLLQLIKLVIMTLSHTNYLYDYGKLYNKKPLISR